MTKQLACKIKAGNKEIVAEALKIDWLSLTKPDKRVFEDALEYSIDVVRHNLEVYERTFLDSSSKNNVYPERDNSPWTTGFCTGMVWLAYGATKEKSFLRVGKIHTKSFEDRLERKHGLSHDIGFLYSLSAVADYMLTGDELAKELAIKAADELGLFYRPIPGIIQRGGDMEDSNHRFTGVFIVDCFLNLPLMYWASQATGDRKYYDMAYSHAKNGIEALVDENARVIQSAKGDIFSGELTNDQMQSQGYQHMDACWSRGQAWAMYGLALSYDYTRDDQMLDSAKAVTNYYLNRLPSDYIANWDLYYTEDDVVRDTSASAIAVCGMLEMASHLPICDQYRQIIEMAALKTLESLSINYLTTKDVHSNALLKSGTYAYNTGRGIDEACIWGDYYYMEALCRVLRYEKRFW